MLSKKANIIGLLCSDGNYREYVSRYIEFDKKRNKYYNRVQNKRIMEFANTNILLLQKFQELLNFVYGYKPNIIFSNNRTYRVCIVKKYVIDDILRYVVLGNNKWYVPKFVMEGNDAVKLGFIQGYFDGDGSIDLNQGKYTRVRFGSINLNGLKQLKKILEDLKMECSLNGPYKRIGKKDAYEILLKRKGTERFINLIQSSHSKKKSIIQSVTEKAFCRDR